MIASMTGYGRHTVVTDSLSILVEMKSVNHRFCEIALRMPKQLMVMEENIKKIINEHIERGRIDVFISIGGQPLINRHLEVDWSLLDDVVQTLQLAKDHYKIEAPMTLDHLLTFSDVFSIAEQEKKNEELKQLLLQSVKQATLELAAMRQREGEILKVALSDLVKQLKKQLDELIVYAPQVLEQYRQKLKKRIDDCLSEQAVEIDEMRLLNEVAVFSDKYDITEECTRLQSHLTQFLHILEQTGTVGRKLDFLIQEMNRETNTIGSKANDYQISMRVVEMKSIIEKMKEQVQNIE